MSSTTGHSLHHPIHPEARWKSILEAAAREVFSMMVGIELEEFPEPPLEPQGEQIAMVGLAGALCGMVTVRCDSKTAVKLATLMLGGDAASNPSTTGDALGEICNMVAGNFKNKIASLADHCMLSVPTVIWGEDYVLQTVQPHEGFQVVLSCEGAAIWFSLITHM
jgi:chemotaxis protein CheX